MMHFEDLEVGSVFTVGGIEVGAQQATEFARLYDPAFIPCPNTTYVHRGPRISPWQAAAFSSRLLSNLAASQPVEQCAFSDPRDLAWRNEVRITDALRLEVEVMEILSLNPRSVDHGWARVKVTLIATGAAGFGAWGDDDGELVDDIVLTYTALMQAGRRGRATPMHDIA